MIHGNCFIDARIRTFAVNSLLQVWGCGRWGWRRCCCPATPPPGTSSLTRPWPRSSSRWRTVRRASWWVSCVLSIVVTVTIIVSTLGGCRHPEPLRAEAAAGGRGHQLRHVLQQQRAAAHPRARRRIHTRHREGQLGVKTTLWTLGKCLRRLKISHNVNLDFNVRD